jgi:hypothetical protein
MKMPPVALMCYEFDSSGGSDALHYVYLLGEGE